MLKVGLTGGIACGKSTASDFFIAQGVTVIDADLVARQVVEPGQPALQEIIELFGEEILADDRTLERRKLRDIVFRNPALRIQLEQILHPRIRQEMQRQANAATRTPYLIFAIPLLVEGNSHHHLDRILVIDMDREVQIRRLQQRDHISRDQCLRMLEAQASREERLAAADDVVDNSGDVPSLHRQLTKLHHSYLNLKQ